MRSPQALPILACLLAVHAVAAAQAVSTGTATISGRVLGPGGVVAANASVSAVIVSLVAPRKTATQIPMSFSTSTLPDGSYKLAGVPAGTYRVCAEAAGLLPVCRWGGGANVVVSASAASASAAPIQLADGATLSVHLTDSASALSKGALFALQVSTPTGYIPLPATGSTSATRDYQMMVPYNTALSLQVLAKGVTMNGPQGALDYAHQTIPVSFAAGAAATPAINLSITSFSGK